MRTNVRTGAIAGAFGVAALLGGCGGGADTSSISTVGTGTSTTPASLSHASYVRQADTICAESDAAISGISAGSTAGEQAASTTQEIQIMRDELSSLQSLGAPANDSPDRFLSALGKVASQLGRKRLALQRNDTAALPSIVSAIDAAQTSAGSTASAYGFKRCGTFGTPSGTPVSGAPSSSTPTTPAPPTTTTPTPPATPAPVLPPTGGAGTPPPPTTTPPSGGVGPGSGGVSP